MNMMKPCAPKRFRDNNCTQFPAASKIQKQSFKPTARKSKNELINAILMQCCNTGLQKIKHETYLA